MGFECKLYVKSKQESFVQPEYIGRMPSSERFSIFVFDRFLSSAVSPFYYAENESLIMK